MNRASRQTWQDISGKVLIMPFSDQMLDVFVLGIRWAASELGAVAERADDLEHNGEIISEIRHAMRSTTPLLQTPQGQIRTCVMRLGTLML
jgi:hypothetical protein